MMSGHDSRQPGGIAIVGMAGRFAEAPNLDAFWRALAGGVECIRRFTDEELLARGVPAALLKRSEYVKAGAVLDGIDLFDAAFFGFSPREAEIMDPQQRLFLECAWETLENAGCDPARFEGLIAVYAGVSINTYVHNLYANREVMASVGGYQLMIGNDKDFLATRVAYKLNLRGPALTVQTACSTSLVAVHLACQQLSTYQCDLALAGGACINPPQGYGYMYQPGMILSPDGHCRPFDAKASGTVSGTGLGIVALKRLEDALRDNDTIHAVIKGSAINNDGANKIGYTAPSIEGQAEAIAEALAMADFDPATVTCIEAHGTGTELGDPIEIAALTQAFGDTARKQYCALGSLKSNLGHLDAAAGVAGLIKAVLALEHRQIPPSLHFEEPNPKIDFAGSPFFVNTSLRDWETNGHPRRAGVSSFGIGGTNAHVVLEEAPAVEPTGPSRSHQLLLLSARSAKSLNQVAHDLSDHLRRYPEVPLADIAYTLQVGRQPLDHRRALVVANREEAIAVLTGKQRGRMHDRVQEPVNRSVAFMFSGQGSQYVNMARGLYDAEPAFTRSIDACCEILAAHLDCDLRALLYPSEREAESAASRLAQTRFTQPALFTTEYALAQLWMSWGVRPAALIGHSIGEYVAACLAGVMSLEDALSLVAARGHLMQSLPAGAMLAVHLPPHELQAVLTDGLSLAAVNGPNLCVASGPTGAIETLATQLEERTVGVRRLHTSHAFHSGMMDPILDEFRQRVRRVPLHAPQIPYISNRSATWITPAQATDPDYYAQHLRHAVQFAPGLSALLNPGGVAPTNVLLEVGPGTALTSLARQQVGRGQDIVIVNSLRHAQEAEPDFVSLLAALGELWTAGVEADWSAFYRAERRRRVPLPTYPFERKRFWVEPKRSAAAPPRRSSDKRPDVKDWFFVPGWRTAASLPSAIDPQLAQRVLILADDLGLSGALRALINHRGGEAVEVRPGGEFRAAEDLYFVQPAEPADYHRMLADLAQRDFRPQVVVHAWLLTEDARSAPDASMQRGLGSLLALAQAIGQDGSPEPVRMLVLSNGAQHVLAHDRLDPHKATAIAACRVIPQEYANIRVVHVDLDLVRSAAPDLADHARRAWGELATDGLEPALAYRGGQRWARFHEPLRLQATSAPQPVIRERGVYAITGGLGGVATAFGLHLAREVRARLALIVRGGLPDRDNWDAWVTDHPLPDRTTAKINRVRELESAGSEVLVLEADVTDEHALQRAFVDAERHFGMLHGVIHAAGNMAPETFLPVQKLSADVISRQFAPKVAGLQALERALGERELDFVMLTSSLSTVLGGMGYAAYAAANLFMDAFVAARPPDPRQPWQVVNWDAWQLDPAPQAAASALARLALTVPEGQQAFGYLLGMPAIPQIVVSTSDLEVRMGQWVRLGWGARAGETAPTAAAPRHERPELESDYEAPAGETEESLASIWRGLLGYDRVGRHDDFFLLGGHSLLATQLISRIREQFDVRLPLRTIFESKTVAELAQALEMASWTAKGAASGTADETEREEIEI